MAIGSGDGEGSNDPVTDLLVPGCVTERGKWGASCLKDENRAREGRPAAKLVCVLGRKGIESLMSYTS